MRPNPKAPHLATEIDVVLDPALSMRGELRRSTAASLSNSIFVAPRLVAASMRLLDGVVMLCLAIGTALRYPGLSIHPNLPLYLTICVFAAIALPTLFTAMGLYRLQVLLAPAENTIRTLVGWISLFVIIAIGIVLFKVGTELSRNWLLTWSVAGFFAFIAVRFIISSVLHSWNTNGQFNRRAVIVGGGEPAERVVAALASSHNPGVSIVGFFDDRDDVRVGEKAHNIQKLGGIDDLIDFARATRVDCLIMTLPVTAEERLLQLLSRLWILPVDIRLSAQGQKLRYRPRAYSYIGNLPCLDMFDRPLGDWGPVLKAGLDKGIAALAILALSPVLAGVALAVKLSSKGPVLFKQKRYGFNNELIEIYKFRSMYVDQADLDAAKLVTKGDPRVTKIGKFIRRTSLDELPQLFNVLNGGLSLVGPRPHATKAMAANSLYEHVVDGYFARHKVKPGITGWAQINGWRGETDTAEKIERRVEHDLYYIENWSLTFDLYILARTPLSLLNTDNAY